MLVVVVKELFLDVLQFLNSLSSRHVRFMIGKGFGSKEKNHAIVNYFPVYCCLFGLLIREDPWLALR